MKRQYTVALCQMDSREDRERNWKSACALLEEAARLGASLAVLPEIFNVIDKGETPPEPVPEGPTITMMAEKAREYGMWILCGSIFEENPQGDRKYNTSVLLDPNGSLVGKYSKLHMFDITIPSGKQVFESKRVKPGGSIVTLPTELGTLGLSICYDIRFPELYRAMALEGAEVILAPSEFNVATGKHHWEPLLRARAIENQCYVIAPNQIGTKNGFFNCYASSMVIDPEGNVIARASERPGVTLAPIDLDLLDRVRGKGGGLACRRDDVYRLKWRDSTEGEWQEK